MGILLDKWLPAIHDALTGEDSYNPQHGWSTLAQPTEKLDSTAYLELAAQGLPNFRKRMVAFCDRNNFTYVEIPHEAYRNGFEKGAQKFRPWLNEYCHSHGLNPNAHIAIVGPCVKDESSTAFKSKVRPDERVRDYLRGMFIFLDGPSAKTAKQSIDNLGSAIDSLENDEEFKTLARKNYLHTPKANGYRAYKAAWTIDLPGPFAEWQTLAELKIEHERQQDANRMTRRFMSISRKARDAMEGFYPNCTSDPVVDARSANHNMTRMKHRVEDLDRFSLYVYNYIHEKSGLNRFLGKRNVDSHAPLSAEQMQAAAKKAIEAFSPNVSKEIELADLRLPGVRTQGERLDKTYS